jgi:RNA recognition motif-containing protein
MRLFVGNLPFSTDDEELRELFGNHGAVHDAQVIKDRDNPERSRGFGFVEMGTDAEARAAISALDGYDLHGRTLNVNEARARESRNSGGGNGGGGDRRRSRK